MAEGAEVSSSTASLIIIKNKHLKDCAVKFSHDNQDVLHSPTYETIKRLKGGPKIE